MTTASAIIRSALGKLGVVSPADSVKPEDSDTALRALNLMLDAWRLERLYAYAITTVDHALVAAAESLTIGPTGDIVVTPRPVRIELGSYYTAGDVDYPLERVTEAEFNRIAIKQIGGLGPVKFTYNPALPNGELRFYPQATPATLHLLVQTILSSFAALQTSYTLPPGYERALIYSLAEEIAADYEREVPPTVARNAANARRLLKRANHDVPQLQVGESIEGPLALILAG